MDLQACRTHLCPHLELYDFYFVGDDWRFVALVKGIIEHLDSVCVKLVGEAWPFKCERHFCALTAVIFQPASIRKVQRRVKTRWASDSDVHFFEDCKMAVTARKGTAQSRKQLLNLLVP
jgi:hypothetical protein